MKEVKHYNEHRADVRVAELQKQAKTLGELVRLLKETTSDKEIKSLGAFNDWLCKEAGFKSPSFSADSMDLGDVYRRVKYLSDLTPDVALEDITPMHKLKAGFIDKIREEFKVYFTKEELEVRVKYNKIITEWETLPYEVRISAGVNREGLIKSGHISVK